MAAETDAFELPSYMSPSSLGTFDQCPLRFKYYRLDRLETVPSEAAEIGTFVHEILEHLYELNPSDRTLASARSIASRRWEEEWESNYYKIPKVCSKNDFRWKVWWLVENYFAMEDPTHVEPVGSEDKIEGFINGVPLLGLIDRWTMEDGKAVVSDYKTGKKPRPKYEWEKQKQITIYGMLVEQAHDIEIERVELLYLKPGRVQKYSMDKDAVQRVKDEVGETWQQVQVACKTGEFTTKTGPLCNWCDYQRICPEWN